MSRVEYRLLGPVQALVDGRPVELGGPRPRGVLVVLLTQANTLVPAYRLLDAIWGEDPPASSANLVQRAVSQMRKGLGREAIETRGGGYLVRVEPDALDLSHFERLAHAGNVALAEGRHEEAAALLREALSLWRGPALADLADEDFLGQEAARLEELRLLALERRLEADLACGRHDDLLAEIREIVSAHPLRERSWSHLITALYRGGRQAEALEAYRAARATLVEELGIEPGPALQELERAVLRQDPALMPHDSASTASTEATGEHLRSILIAPFEPDRVRALAALGEPLAREPERELLLAGTVPDPGELPRLSERLADSRKQLLERGIRARSAAFTSLTPGADLVRLATEHDVDLLMVDAPAGLLEDARLLALLRDAPCDVAVLVGRRLRPGPVLVPFGGSVNDWAAIELGAWLAANLGEPLRLAGASTGADGRDASRLLASASLAVQRALDVAAEPLLVEPAPEALVAAAKEAGVVAVGLSDRWRREGLGRVRSALATRAAAPVLLVRRGVRPGGLTPPEQATRFTWTLAEGS
jgi:DNA-binding SARP family transcriptional activator